MKKEFKKRLSIFLCIVMVLCNTLPSLANETVTKIPETKIVEQLKEDLGEEKVEKIINSSEIIEEDFVENKENMNDDKEFNDLEENIIKNEKGKNKEESSDSKEDFIENEENMNDEKEFNGSEEEQEHEIIENNDTVDEILEESEEEFFDDIATDSEMDELVDEEDIENNNVGDALNNNVGDALNNNVGDALHASRTEDESFEEIASKSDIEIKKENLPVLKATTYWCYWYFDEANSTIHYSSTEPVGYSSYTYKGRTSSISSAPRPGSDIRESIVAAVFDNTIIAQSCSSWFNGFTNLTTISNIDRLDTTNVTNMTYMFSGCSSLTTLDLSNFNTQNVTDMHYMFNNCSSLTTLDLSSFNTSSNVTDMSYMFYGCSSLATLDLSNFNTQNVINMVSMFNNCSSLTTLDLSNFNTQNVTNMVSMFSGCSGLTTLELLNFNTQNVTDVHHMFSNCSSLTTLDLSSFNTSKVTDMSNMFFNCSSLATINLSNFNTSNVTDMSNMFFNCSSLATINLSNFNTSNVTTMYRMFYNCSNLTTLDLSNFNTSSVAGDGNSWTGMALMFSGCSSLTTLDLSSFDTQNVTNMNNMFSGCSSLETLNLSSFNTSNVTEMDYMFYNCSSLTTLDLSSFNTENVTDMSRMFEKCSSLTVLDLSSFNTSKVTDMSNMFFNCSSLATINLSSFNTQNVTDMHYMFYGCSSLTTMDLSNFNTSKVTSMTYMFSGCSSIATINLSSFNTSSNVINMSYMFYGCSSLATLDLLNFNTQNVTDMFGMFYNCSSLITLDLSSFDTSKVTDMSNMFYSCSSLTSIDLSSFDTSNVTDMSNMFYGCSSITTLNLSNFITSSLVAWSYIIYNCSNLETVDISNFNITNVISNAGIFKECSKINDIKISASVATVINDLNLEHDWKDYNNSNIYLYDNINQKTTIPNIAGRYVIYTSSARSIVTFESNGGSYIKSITVDNGNIITQPTAPTKNGYIFAGWHNETTLDTLFDFSTPITNNKTLYAKWDNATPIYWYISGGNALHFSGTEPISPDYVSGQMFYSFSSSDEHPWVSQKNDITSVEIDNNIELLSGSYLFAKLVNMNTINGLDNIDTSNTTSMSYMFRDCSSLTTLDLSNFNTEKVTTMYRMFYNCSNLTTINLLNFNTTNVTNMFQMFYNCSSITILNLLNFNTAKVTTMQQMFYNCSSLTSLNISSFNTSKVTSMSSMFYGCEQLTSINVNNFDTSKVTSMRYMFNDCSSLTSLDVSGFNTEKVTDMIGMFYGCEQLTSINVSNFDTSRVTDMGSMFGSCEGLTSLNLSNFNTSNVRGDDNWTSGLGAMFYGCSSLTTLDLSNFNTNNVVNMYRMFCGCENLASITGLNNFDTSNVINMAEMFYQCSNLTTLDLSSFNTSNVTNMSNMFIYCSSLTALELSSFDTSNVTDMSYMFGWCNNLTTIGVSGGFDTSSVTNSDGMFNGCSLLVGGNGTPYDFSHIDKEYARVDATGTPGYFTSVGTMYDVSFDMKGHGTAISTKRVLESGKVQKPATPSCTGYTFMGWYKEDACNNIWNFNEDIVTGNITLYAKWMQTIYTITYDVGGHATVPANTTKTYGINYTLPILSNISSGYTFVNWYSDSALTTIYDGTTDISSTYGDTKTVYAKWKAKITYDVNGHGMVLPASIDVVIGDITPLPILTNITGYTFDTTNSWYEEAACTTLVGASGSNYTVTEPTTLYAKWTVNTYTIKFNLMGVQATTPSDITKTYGVNKTLSDPTNIPSGYNFVGWFSDNTLTTQYTGNTDLSSTQGDIKTLYAKWKQQIIYDANGHGTAPAPIDVTIGDITLPNMTSDGYIFGGWYNEPACINFIGNYNDTYTVTGPKTFYAKWTAIKYKIIYNNIDGATISTDSIIKTYGETIMLDVPTKDGYEFNGWFKENNYINLYVGDTDISTVNNSTVNIYAKWIAITYTINYDVSGHATTLASKTKTYGINYSLPNPSGVQSGYTFVGWFSDNALTTQYYGDTDLTTTQGDTKTLYAKWKARIMYNANGRGTLTKTYEDIVLNDTTTLASVSEVNGYTHENNWYNENTCANIIGTMGGSYIVTEPKTLYVKWTENTYNITLHEDGGTYQGGYTAPTSRLYTQSTNLPNNTQITKTGFTYDGWYDNAGFSGSKITTIPANTAQDKEYWLKWIENTYTITYNTNGGTYVGGYTPQTARTYTQEVILPTNVDITKTGHTFAGWYQTPDFSDTQVTNVSANTTSNKVFYAKWNINTYDVAFNLNGTSGTAPTTQHIVYNNKATKPTDPTASSKVFKYWYKYVTGDPSEENTSFDFNTLITEDITLYAKWDNAWVVTFNMNGATGAAPTSQNIINGEKATKPTNPTADGKRFVYWFLTNESEEFDFNTSITDNTTLKAKWENIVTHDVTFNMNGKPIIAPPIQYIEEGTKAIKPSDPSTNGYIFNYWYKYITGDPSEANTPYDFNTNVTEALSLFAKWTEENYSITYNINGGTWTTAPTEVDTKRLYSESKTLLTTLERSGFTFNGWYNNSDFNGSSLTTISANTAQNYTLYAKWNIVAGNKQVSFNSNGGTSIPALAVTSGGTITQPDNPTKSGYTFAGWFTNIELTNQFNFTTPITEDIILYAKWNQNYTPAPYYPSHGGGGGGGGGGSSISGGSISGNGSLNNAVATTTNRINTTSAIKGTYNNSNVTWNYNPLTNNWNLLINNGTTQATNGFYKITKTETQTVNNTQIQVTNTDTYCFDANGALITGWVQTIDQGWYFFDTNIATFGKGIQNGWKMIDGKWYNFTNDGKMNQNTMTQEGYPVDANGALMDPTGMISQVLSIQYNK